MHLSLLSKPFFQKGLFLALGLIVLAASPNPAAAQTQGGACTGSATAAPDAIGSNLICRSSVWQYVPYIIGDDTSGDATTTCSSAGLTRFNATKTSLQYCDGTNWKYVATSVGGISGSGSTQGNYTFSAPAGATLTIKLWGGGGGAGGAETTTPKAGGSGAGGSGIVLTTYISSATTYYISVGGGGTGGFTDAAGFGPGSGGSGVSGYTGGGGGTGNTTGGGGAGGGSATMVCTGNYCGSGGTIFLIAGGGGGGGGGGTVYAGNAGGTGGGTAGSGGVGGVGGNGVSAGYGAGGGGGGGLVGGTSGSQYPCCSFVGVGGRAGLAGSTSNGGGTTYTGSQPAQGNSTDVNIPTATTGKGATGTNLSGTQGYDGGFYYSF